MNETHFSLLEMPWAGLMVGTAEFNRSHTTVFGWTVPLLLIGAAITLQLLFADLCAGRPFILMYPAIATSCFFGSRFSVALSAVSLRGAYFYLMGNPLRTCLRSQPLSRLVSLSVISTNE